MKSTANKLLSLSLIMLGILFVVLIDQGSGLDSPGFWLVPVGVVLGLLNIVQSRGWKRSRPPLIGWVLTFTSIVLVFIATSDYFSNSEFFYRYDAMFWAMLAALFAIITIPITIIYMFKK